MEKNGPGDDMCRLDGCDAAVALFMKTSLYDNYCKTLKVEVDTTPRESNQLAA